MKIKYVGKKDVEHDTVAGTGLVWGPGEVHEVPEAAALRLLNHPDVWEAVPDSTPASTTIKPTQAPKRGVYEDMEEVEVPPLADFGRMSRDKIDDYCRTYLGTKAKGDTLADVRKQAWQDYGRHVGSLKITTGLRAKQ